MKTKFFILFLLLIPFYGMAQLKTTSSGPIFFGSPYPQDVKVYRDTISNPNCIWQIGQPQKQVINYGFISNKIILTDTLNSYPTNDTSSFIIWQKNQGGWSQGGGIVLLTGYYWVNSDSLSDYGMMEISLDHGNSWINILTDTLYSFFSSFNKPVLTGNSSGWKYFGIPFSKLRDSFPMLLGDSILLKFSFITDGIQTNKDGLGFDMFYLYDWLGINEAQKNIVPCKAYPNPTQDHLTILPLSDHHYRSMQLTILDGLGRKILKQEFMKGEQIKINTSSFPSGLYHYRTSCDEGEYYSTGKFMKE